MANLKAIRIRIASVKSTRQITAAMKMVAAAKLRKAQDKILMLRPYANKLHEVLMTVCRGLQEAGINSVYSIKPPSEKILVVVITSNRGLCGAFNTNIIREARRVAAEEYNSHYNEGRLFYLTIGKKGYDNLRKQGFSIIGEHNDLLNNLTFENVSVAADMVINSFLAGEFGKIVLIYNQFKNAAVQNLMNEQYLPFEILPDDGLEGVPPDYILEPGRNEIIEELIPRYLKIHFYRAVLNSFVAEHGARMTAMHQATDNATTMIRDLTLQYNKARQANITSQILEVVSGAEALKG